MSLQQEVDLLRKIPMFAKIEPAKLKLLAFTSERLSYSDGDVLFRQGEAGDAAFVIISGQAEISIATDDGPLVVARLSDHDFVGEIAILCDVPRTATVTAVTNLEALRISKDLFFRMVKEFPEIAIEVMRELAHRLENTNSRLRDVAGGRNQ
ncbi:MAG: cyclic nucleotide-binding domain-containing protein [Alphaproteobacteria bacterium]|jgi:CRP-like cAMP-binding protein|nr:cyclic nucleotide-binding domain-containing protein [Alphaproteobacteria bacterium]MCK5623668.1 cyclic nucleotide-binding domain-containing protein [Alphaproteobacteria bacterium]